MVSPMPKVATSRLELSDGLRWEASFLFINRIADEYTYH
jgi:hypothetical protein